LCAFLEKEVNMSYKHEMKNADYAVELGERNLWNSGFSSFKRRIDEQLQLNGFDGSMVDDETLLPYYRMGESETYVLSALGCVVGM
jgi:hypothetical protein